MCDHFFRQFFVWVIIASTSSVCGKEALALFQEKLPTINRSAKKIIGHNPAIEIINNDGEYTTQHVAFFCHGWGGSKREAKIWRDLHMPIVTFNFVDATPHLMLKLHKSSFGQIPDVMTMLYALNQLKNALQETDSLHDTKITLIGYSRGGATVVNALNVLCNADNYGIQLKKYGFTRQDCDELFQLIQRGTIVLHCPLTDVFATIQGWSHTIWAMAGNMIQMLWRRRIDPYSVSGMALKTMNKTWYVKKRSFDSFNATYLNYVVLPLLTKYHARGEQAITSIQKLGNLHCPILTTMHKQDKVVNNAAIKSFFRKVYERDTERSYFFVGEGTHVTLPNLEPIKAFVRFHNGFELTQEEQYLLSMLRPTKKQSLDEFITQLGK